jgi:hypothetical protein
MVPLGGHAGQRLAVDRACEIHNQDVAGLGLAGLGERLGLLLGAGQAIERLLHFLVRHLDLDALDLDLAEIHHGDVGQQLDRHGVFQVLARLVGGDLDLGAQRGAQAAFCDCLVRAVVDRPFDDLAFDRAAEALLKHLNRNFARAEPRQADLLAQLLEAVFHFLGQIACRDDDLVLALQDGRFGLFFTSAS